MSLESVRNFVNSHPGGYIRELCYFQWSKGKESMHTPDRYSTKVSSFQASIQFQVQWNLHLNSDSTD